MELDFDAEVSLLSSTTKFLELNLDLFESPCLIQEDLIYTTSLVVSGCRLKYPLKHLNGWIEVFFLIVKFWQSNSWYRNWLLNEFLMIHTKFSESNLDLCEFSWMWIYIICTTAFSCSGCRLKYSFKHLKNWVVIVLQ